MPTTELITALKDLYIISSAAAQLGSYGLAVSDVQWRALVRQTAVAKDVLVRQTAARELEVKTALCRLVRMCDDILALRTTSGTCPPSAWRQVGKLGHDAYEYLELKATGR